MRIVDNAVPDFAALQSAILAPGFPWYYARATKEGDVNPYLYSWLHLVFDDGKWYSASAEFIFNAIKSAMIAAGEPVRALHRIRIVLNTITDQPYLNGAHVDLTIPHKTALLYVNDADGDTVIYEERWRPEFAGGHTVAAKIRPVANRMLLFDGLRFHTGTTPVKTNRRVVLNINYE